MAFRAESLKIHANRLPLRFGFTVHLSPSVISKLFILFRAAGGWSLSQHAFAEGHHATLIGQQSITDLHFFVSLTMMILIFLICVMSTHELST